MTMSEHTRDLARHARELGAPTTGDHIAAIVKAAFNAVPIVGGPIASLLDDYIPASREKRIREFAEDVAEALEDVRDGLKEEYVRTDEFAYLFVRVFQNVTRDYQKEKLEAYKNILVNALRVDIEAAVQERFLMLVEQLTPLHLRVLQAFVSDDRNASVLGPDGGGGVGSLLETLRRLLPEIPEEHIERCAFDLDQFGITGSLTSSLKAMMSRHGARLLTSRVTTFGRQFINFVMTR